MLKENKCLYIYLKWCKKEEKKDRYNFNYVSTAILYIPIIIASFAVTTLETIGLSEYKNKKQIQYGGSVLESRFTLVKLCLSLLVKRKIICHCKS